MMSDLGLAVIGNCGIGALIDHQGRLVWACFPRFDGDPMFHALLNGSATDGDDARGFWDVPMDGPVTATQAYVPHTAILRTILEAGRGDTLEIVDFAPRFQREGAFVAPPTLVRLIRPLRGAPRIRIRLRPDTRYGAARPRVTSGRGHIRYAGEHWTLRCTTDAPVEAVLEEKPFSLHRPIAMILGPDARITRSIADAARDLHDDTLQYWREFTRALSIPFEWQEEVIRAAISLKLCSDDASGAIIAAMTTSIPEAPQSGRNWDYRYCWLRDAYFVVHALNRLGATQTLERYLDYIGRVIATAPDGVLRPVYALDPAASLAEREVPLLSGYRGMGPVRVGNEAWMQVQNDVYGSAILASTHVFFDSRLAPHGTDRLFRELERLGEHATQRYDQPDAGLWEFRQRQAVHTFSSVMCWAACDRLAKIARRIGRAERAAHWRRTADAMHSEILARAWNPDLGRFGSTWGADGADASLLLLHDLGFLPADDARFVSTVDHLAAVLSNGPYLMRYVEDELGRADTAFTVCTFWYIDALAALGRRAEARELFEEMLRLRNHVGLLSEDVDPRTGELWGNFPQTYSMVGLINSAMRLSTSWEHAY